MSIFTAMFCYSLAFSSAEVVKVGQWDRFEVSVTNTNSYTDPYAHVTLNVTYTRPDSSEVDFWGFYDGGTTWKTRFMPDQLGTWSYRAEFSDGSPGVRGIFECVTSTIPGMLTADETNPIWFGFKGGRHILIRSYHVGDRFFAENWQESNRAAFLDWAQAQGYNMLSIASHYLNRDTPGRGEGWDTPDLWPLNASEYRKMEAILDDLTRRRVERGFNQSELIGRRLGKAMGVPMAANVLRRRRYTSSQVRLTRRQRLENLRGAFDVADKKRVRGRSILVVDDIMTTGATASECARTLKRAGAKDVCAVVVAR